MTNINDEVLLKFSEAVRVREDVPEELLESLIAELAAGGGNSDRVAELIKSAAGNSE